MKIVRIETLVSVGTFANSIEWAKARTVIHEAVTRVDWPDGSGKFTIKPIPKGNGVKAIKKQFVDTLRGAGWQTEKPIQLQSDLQPGNLDFMLTTSFKPIAIEWETGNVSSCHRSMNKLALGLVQGVISAGVMCVASNALAKYLTDRIGNYNELAPYVPFWQSIHCANGVLEIVVFEHDNTDHAVNVIPKMIDGMAQQAKIKAVTGSDLEEPELGLEE